MVERRHAWFRYRGMFGIFVFGLFAMSMAVDGAMAGVEALAESSGLPLPSWIRDVVGVVDLVVFVVMVSALPLVVLIGWFDARIRARAEAAFSAVVSRTAAQLEPGTLARVRVVIEPPPSLTAPFFGTGCAYYRAAALVQIRYEDDLWLEDRVRCVGEIARARDSSGEIELDLRSGVDVIGTNALRQITDEKPHDGDPLSVGIAGAYRVALQYLQAGDEVEVAGHVERTADRRYRIVPAKRRLQVRVVTAEGA